MEEVLEEDSDEDNFLKSSKVQKNFNFLKENGILDHIEFLNWEIRNYKSLLARGLDIFNRTSIDEIMDSAVYQISDQFLPSFIAFIWKPIQTREDITMKAYKNYRPVDINLSVDNISPFETFFKQYPKPIQFGLLAYQMDNDMAVKPYLDINTEIAVPIIGPFGLYGIILVGRKILNEGYNRDELFFLQQLMCFVSQAIKNHLHYEHSLHDVKTGLYNHGFFLARLDEEIVRIKRNNYHSSIMVIDVDRFKKFNDTYGHLAGDKVLENIAQVIMQGIRRDDIASRFGGEEFTILLPNTDDITAWNVAERLRTNVADMNTLWKINLPQVTISVGIYTFDKNIDSDASDIIRRADEAVYFSKDSGRNCCTMWNPGIIDPQPG
ncbi:MAG: sensor domain-containing diguanylate cyclase [Treponema sp.]|nr:sensor domain-containing diguanylate cyclase [Treponema sp.]MCL2272559.1 sensor domain-containing diguanylate cyclase [Treponema sp.]